MPSEAELDALAEQMMGEDPSPEPVPSPPVEVPAPDSQPDTQLATAESTDPVEVPATDDLADPAEVKDWTAEEYARQVPGTDLTVGQLKDQAKELAKADETRQSLEGEQSEFRTQRMSFQRMLRSTGLDNLSDEQQQQVQTYTQQGMQAEANLILGAIPGWSDDETLRSESHEIGKHWAAYGVGQGEINQLLLTDARFAKREHDLMMNRRNLAMAREKLKGQQKKGAQKPTRTVSTGQKQRLQGVADNASASPEDRQLAAFLGGQLNGNGTT